MGGGRGEATIRWRWRAASAHRAPASDPAALKTPICPVMVIAGAQDESRKAADTLAGLIPGGSYHEVPGDRLTACSAPEFRTPKCLRSSPRPRRCTRATRRLSGGTPAPLCGEAKDSGPWATGFAGTRALQRRLFVGGILRVTFSAFSMRCRGCTTPVNRDAWWIRTSSRLAPGTGRGTGGAVRAARCAACARSGTRPCQ